MGFSTVFGENLQSRLPGIQRKEKRNMKGGPLMEVVPALQARSNTVPG